MRAARVFEEEAEVASMSRAIDSAVDLNNDDENRPVSHYRIVFFLAYSAWIDFIIAIVAI